MRRHRQSDRVLSLVPETEDSAQAYAYLLERAEEFVRERGACDEQGLIRHVFGAATRTELWRPLLRLIMAGSETLEELHDGAWRVRPSEPVPSSALGSFVALDVETTGLGAHQHRVIEIGLVRFSGGREIERYVSYTQPDRRLPVFITRLTGISDADLVSAPRFVEIAEQVLEFIGDSVIVGHNVGFDLSFVNAELKRADRPFLVNDSLDTMTTGMRLLAHIRRPNLARLAHAAGVKQRRAHRAVDDAYTTGMVMHYLLRIAAEQGYRTYPAIKLLSTGPKESGVAAQGSRGPGKRREKIPLDLPRKPGVYIMRDANDRVIYIGKARNLRDRVGSYFSQPIGLTRKMDGLVESIAKIDIEETGSELGALLLEAQLIRWHQPGYNTAMRSSEEYPFIRVDLANPWPRISSSKRQKDGDGSIYFGPFRSQSLANSMLRFLHDTLPLRSCTRTFRNARSYGRPCLEVQLGRCLGPCTGLADPAEYRRHVETALAFLQGRDDQLLRHFHNQLEQATIDQDYETARKVRNSISVMEQMLAATSELREANDPALAFLVSPSGDPGARNLIILTGGRIWASLRFTRTSDATKLARVIERSLDRLTSTKARLLDHSEVDDAAIMLRWLHKAPELPSYRSMVQNPDPDEVATWALELSDAEVDIDKFTMTKRASTRDESDQPQPDEGDTLLGMVHLEELDQSSELV